MATLEVHHSQGRVERIEVSREHPMLFGTSPNCDIVLSGQGILPFHGRVRWKGNRYKADASPEAEYLIVNGHRMAACSFRQGDEIQVGPCRIFMLLADDDLPPQDDKTRIQAPPVVGAKPKLDGVDWARDLEIERPARRTITAEPELRRGHRGVAPRPEPAEAPKPQKKVTLRGWGGFVAALRGRGTAPGEERILSSPVVIGLGLALIVLTTLGIGLRGVIARTAASRLFNQAVDSFDDGDYRTAMKRFDDFLAANKGDTRAGKARVLRALANVRQFTGATGASWSNALEAEREMVETVGGEEAYRDSSPDLDELVIRTGEELADRARLSANAKVLDEAESTVPLHNRIAGKAAEGLLSKSRLPVKLAEAREAVRKAEIRTAALKAMDTALKKGSSGGVYEARDALVRLYGDLAEDRELVAKLTQANDLIRRAVKVDASRRPAETEPRVQPFGPPTSLVFRAAPPPNSRAVANAGTVLALADGFAFGIDGATGAPRWQLEVGLASPFPPQPIPGGTAALVFDARSNELLKVDVKTGALIWRQETGGLIADPPLILGNQLIQPTPGADGNLLLLDLKSGELQGTVQLHLPLARTPSSDEAGQYLYALADQDCLFVIRRDPPECVAVEYLGHSAGSIPCAPVRLGRFFIVSENTSIDEHRWRIFVLEEEGARVRTVQHVTHPGWAWGSPPSAGTVLWAVGDRAGVAAYALGGYEEKNPLRLIAKLNPDRAKSGPAFAFTRTERELWVAGGRSGRFDLSPEKGALKSAWTLPDAGPALAPLQMAGSLLVFTEQAREGSGVTLWGVDQATGAVVWRTRVGVAWPIPLAESSNGTGLTTLSADGRALSIDESKLNAGGFVEGELPRPGQLRLPAGKLDRLDSEGVTILIAAEHADYMLVRSGKEDAFHRVDLPAPLAARPLFWNRDLLVPGIDSRVYLLDPATGESRAEPYVPAFDRTHKTVWRAPARLDGETVVLADESGIVRRMTRPADPRPRLAIAGEVDLKKEIVADPVSTGGAVVLVTGDNRIRSLAARDLSPSGAWPLDTALAMPLAAVGGRAFIADKAGGVLAIGPEGQRLWSMQLRGAPAAGPPVLKDEEAWFLARDGSLQRVALADGSILDHFPLGILPVGGLRLAGKALVVPVGLGTVRVLQTPTTSESK